MNILGIDLLIGPVLTTVIIGLTTIVLIAWYSSRNHDYWKKRGVPYVKPIPFLGSVLQNSFEPLHDVEVKRYKQYGAVYGHFEGNNPLLSVADPDLLREIFVKDFHIFPNRRSFAVGDKILDNMVSTLAGEDWKRVRTIITPTFTTGKIKRMLNIFKGCAATVVQNFKEVTKNGSPVDAKRIYGAYTMDVIASSAFSTKIDSHNDPENEFVKCARQVFSRNLSWRFVMLVLAPKLMKLLRIPVFDPVGTNFFKRVTMQILEERRQSGKKRNDFLQLLMDTASEVETEQKSEDAEKDGEENVDNYGEEGSALKGFKNVSSKNLSMDELVAQCVIFFLAGYDTTASTLSFASYLLALNPDIQVKAREEVDRIIKEHKGELNYEGIQEMKYLDNVISETLRIFPPAVRLERVADADYELGNTGITVPKGMIISIPNYAMHHDPNLFPDPEKFDPDRFSVEERSQRQQYTYLPFGAGPRNCIGMRFALMEIKACLALVLANFIIKKSPRTKVPLDFFIGQQLLQPKEILLDMEERKDGPLAR